MLTRGEVCNKRVKFAATGATSAAAAAPVVSVGPPFEDAFEFVDRSDTPGTCPGVWTTRCAGEASRPAGSREAVVPVLDVFATVVSVKTARYVVQRMI